MEGDGELVKIYGADIVAGGTSGVTPVPQDDRQDTVKRWVRRIAWALDESIEIPGTGRRIGLDGIIGLIPVIGDSATLTASITIIVSGIASGASAPTIFRMVLNTTVDAVVGNVPVAGQIWDFFFKANTRNIRLLEADLDDRDATKRSSLKVLAIGAVVVLVVVMAFLISMYYLLRWIF